MNPNRPSPPPKKNRGALSWLRWPSLTIDLNQPAHRRNLFIAFVALVVVTVGLLLAGYQSYTYTESAEFCGTACHVMKPQFVRYEAAPHATEECVK